MPISRVRRRTAYARVPYRPTPASSTAKLPSPDERPSSKRSCAVFRCSNGLGLGITHQSDAMTPEFGITDVEAFGQAGRRAVYTAADHLSYQPETEPAV